MNTKKVVGFVLLMCLIFPFEKSDAQFLYRPKRNYMNYGAIDYRPYASFQQLTYVSNRYDMLGNYLILGRELFNWDDYYTDGVGPMSLIYKDYMRVGAYQLFITRDSYRDQWSSSFMMGEAIRTNFTPLTLGIVRLAGVRWDTSIRDNNLSVVYSRISNPDYLPRMKGWTEIPLRIPRRESIYLLGGRWEYDFRDVFKLGTTFASIYRSDCFAGVGENSITGVPPSDCSPDSIIVRFTDDSPRDGVVGAAVFSISAEIKVKEGDKTIIRTDIVPIERRSGGVVEVGQHLEISGEGYVDYYFLMPPNAYEARFSAVVANDYQISLSQSHMYTTDKGKPEERRPDFFAVRRAEGNVQDLSNKMRVYFDYGLSTASIFYGADLEFRLGGFELRAELVRNTCYYQFPTYFSDKKLMKDVAYFINLKKNINQFTLGGEIFYLGPKYYSYDLTGMTFFRNEAFINPFNPGSRFDDDNTMSWALVDDNDDNDQYPDGYTYDGPLSNVVEAGVFPGRDKNQDGIIDYNRNNNAVPDWDEPFLMYYAEPQRFVYGDDFNNNGVIDAWENDDRVDYPYVKDTRGTHLFGVCRLQKWMKLTLGSYDTKEVAGGGRSKANYLKFEYLRHFPEYGEFEFDYDCKRVEDNIRDLVYDWEIIKGYLVTEAKYIVPAIEDRLTMRNSFVHTSFIGTRFSRIPNLNIINNAKLMINQQRESVFRDGSYQDEDRITFLGIVSKADYTYRYKKLVVMPMVKYLYQKETQRSLAYPIAHSTTFAPILKIDYDLTPKTKLQFGIQGFPSLEDKYEDKVDDTYSLSSQHYIAMFTHRSSIHGYGLAITGGYHYQIMDWKLDGKEDFDYSRVFIRIYASPR